MKIVYQETIGLIFLFLIPSRDSQFSVFLQLLLTLPEYDTISSINRRESRLESSNQSNEQLLVKDKETSKGMSHGNLWYKIERKYIKKSHHV